MYNLTIFYLCSKVPIEVAIALLETVRGIPEAQLEEDGAPVAMYVRTCLQYSLNVSYKLSCVRRCALD